MHVLLALTDVAPSLLNRIDGNLIIAAIGRNSGERFADTLRDFIAPLFLLAISIAAMTFLFKRQVTEFLQFCALGIGVAVFFYVPGIVENIARFIASVLS